MEDEMAIDTFDMRGTTTVVTKVAGVTCLASRTSDHRQWRSIMGRRLCARKRHSFVWACEIVGPKKVISARNVSAHTKVQGSYHIDQVMPDILCYFKRKLGFGFTRIFLL